MSIKSETFFEKCYKWIEFSKENSYYSMKRLKKKKLLLLANKLLEEIPENPCNAKEHYQWFIRKKNTKSIITEHPKIWHKLSKIIKQTEKVSFNNSLYSDKKKWKFFKRKKCKNNKKGTCF